MAGQTFTIEELQEVERKRNICLCRMCPECFKKGKKQIKRIKSECKLVYEGCKSCYDPIVSLEACVRGSCQK